MPDQYFVEAEQQEFVEDWLEQQRVPTFSA